MSQIDSLKDADYYFSRATVAAVASSAFKNAGLYVDARRFAEESVYMLAKGFEALAFAQEQEKK